MKCQTLSKRISQLARPLASTSLHKAIEKPETWNQPNTQKRKIKQKWTIAKLDLTTVSKKESGEGADFKHSGFIPRQVKLVDLPAINVGVIIPWLQLLVLPLVLHLLPLFSCSIAQFIFSYLDNYNFAFIMKVYIKLTCKFHPLILLTKPIKPLDEKKAS